MCCRIMTCRSAIANKPLRFLTRFLVVSLLLNRPKLVGELLEELRAGVEQYSKNFTAEAGEWPMVLHEISSFLQVPFVSVSVCLLAAALCHPNPLGVVDSSAPRLSAWYPFAEGTVGGPTICSPPTFHENCSPPYPLDLEVPLSKSGLGSAC